MLISCSAIKIGNLILSTAEVTEKTVQKVFEALKYSETYFDYIKSESNDLCFFTETDEIFIFEWKNYYLIEIENGELKNLDLSNIGKHTPNGAEILVKNFIGTIRIGHIIIHVESLKMSAEQISELSKYIENKIASLSLSFSKNAIGYIGFIPETNEFDFNSFIMLFNEMKNGTFFQEIKKILYNPHYILENRKEVKSISTISQISEDSIRDIFTGDFTLLKTNSINSLSKKLHYDDNYFLPKELAEYNSEISYDTSENQFIQYFLNHCMYLTDKFIKYFTTNNKLVDIDFIEQLETFHLLINKQLKHAIFSEVNHLTYLNTSSKVLSNTRGYRYMYNLFNTLKNTPTNYFSTEDYIELFQNKSVDKLYEYYCLFSVIDILDDLLGTEQKEVKITIDTSNLSVSLSESNNSVFFVYNISEHIQVMLSFQHTYTKNNGGTYSIQLAPDLSLKIMRNGATFKIYHFDSKFRIKRHPGSDTLFNNDEDVAKMHAYRDSILKTVGCFVLYPGTNSVFYEIDSNNIYSGVGAIPLNVNSNKIELKKILRKILSPYYSFSENGVINE